MDLIMRIVLLLGALLTALITGLFYAYACSVNAGLGRLSDAEYLKAMQHINRAILNPWFFASFMGTVVVLPLGTWLLYRTGHTEAFYYLLAATVLYLMGTFGVTIFGNVPLNEALDKFDIGASELSAIKSQRLRFEVPWNSLNLVRTWASILSMMLVLVALFKQ